MICVSKYRIHEVVNGPLSDTITTLQQEDSENFTLTATRVHASTGLLQNLSVCKATKREVGESCIAALLVLANIKSIGGIRIQCITALKNLCMFPNSAIIFIVYDIF
jgi:hypothetical protein